ncbi:MAG: hypothetical protein LBD23_10250 [Oscillospiraceae bacterium]|jgi:uncharacterized protein YjaG (DUF416 family)|nr:hypothetical protein [Oscillospiraceae bacterium]
MRSRTVKVIYGILPAVILCVGVCMMIFSILRGELQEIFNKAIVVCLECIGIG